MPQLSPMLFALLGFPWYGWTFALSLAGLLWWSAIVAKQGAERADKSAAGEQMFPRDPKASATDQDLRDLSIGAFLSAMWWFPVNTVRTNVSKAKMQNVMAESWDVKSGSDAKMTLRWLLDSGHRGSFDAVLRVAGLEPSNTSDAELQDAFGEGGAIELNEPHGHYVATYDTLRSRRIIESADDLARGTSAWDYSRAVTVARFCHTAEFLTEDEAWRFIREAGHRARSEFSSWREFHKSYILGRAIWNGMSQLEDPEMNAVFEAVAEGDQSPWRAVSWS